MSNEAVAASFLELINKEMANGNDLYRTKCVTPLFTLGVQSLKDLEWPVSSVGTFTKFKEDKEPY